VSMGLGCGQGCTPALSVLQCGCSMRLVALSKMLNCYAFSPDVVCTGYCGSVDYMLQCYVVNISHETAQFVTTPYHTVQL